MITKETLMPFLQSMGISVLISVLCYIIIFVAKRIVKKSMEKNSRLMGERRAKTTYSVLLSIIKYTVYFIGFFQIFTIWGGNPASLLAIAGVSSVALGLGAQSFIKDVVTGFFILLEDQFAVSDVVTIGDISGVVEEVTLRTTRIRMDNGSLAIIPNSTITIVQNQSKQSLESKGE